jgi:hypothetical protein
LLSNHPLCRSDAERGTFILCGTRTPEAITGKQGVCVREVDATFSEIAMKPMRQSQKATS